MSRIWTSHVTHLYEYMNESCHTYEGVMSHIIGIVLRNPPRTFHVNHPRISEASEKDLQLKRVFRSGEIFFLRVTSYKSFCSGCHVAKVGRGFCQDPLRQAPPLPLDSHRPLCLNLCHNMAKAMAKVMALPPLPTATQIVPRWKKLPASAGWKTIENRERVGEGVYENFRPFYHVPWSLKNMCFQTKKMWNIWLWHTPLPSGHMDV